MSRTPAVSPLGIRVEDDLKILVTALRARPCASQERRSWPMASSACPAPMCPTARCGTGRRLPPHPPVLPVPLGSPEHEPDGLRLHRPTSFTAARSGRSRGRPALHVRPAGPDTRHRGGRMSWTAGVRLRRDRRPTRRPSQLRHTPSTSNAVHAHSTAPHSARTGRSKGPTGPDRKSADLAPLLG